MNRISWMIVATVLGLIIGCEMGQPAQYWHGQASETEHWALWTGGCAAAGAIIALLFPMRPKK